MTVETDSITADTATRIDEIGQALEQVLSLIATAERLLAEGQGVNIARLGRRVATICEAVAALPRAEADRFASALEVLLRGLDRLEAATRRAHALVLATAAPVAEGLSGPAGARANAAYRRTLEASDDTPATGPAPGVATDDG